MRKLSRITKATTLVVAGLVSLSVLPSRAQGMAQSAPSIDDGGYTTTTDDGGTHTTTVVYGPPTPPEFQSAAVPTPPGPLAQSSAPTEVTTIDESGNASTVFVSAPAANACNVDGDQRIPCQIVKAEDVPGTTLFATFSDLESFLLVFLESEKIKPNQTASTVIADAVCAEGWHTRWRANYDETSDAQYFFFSRMKTELPGCWALTERDNERQIRRNQAILDDSSSAGSFLQRWQEQYATDMPIVSRVKNFYASALSSEDFRRFAQIPSVKDHVAQLSAARKEVSDQIEPLRQQQLPLIAREREIAAELASLPPNDARRPSLVSERAAVLMEIDRLTEEVDTLDTTLRQIPESIGPDAFMELFPQDQALLEFLRGIMIGGLNAVDAYTAFLKKQAPCLALSEEIYARGGDYSLSYRRGEIMTIMQRIVGSKLPVVIGWDSKNHAIGSVWGTSLKTGVSTIADISPANEEDTSRWFNRLKALVEAPVTDGESPMPNKEWGVMCPAE